MKLEISISQMHVLEHPRLRLINTQSTQKRHKLNDLLVTGLSIEANRRTSK